MQGFDQDGHRLSRESCLFQIAILGLIEHQIVGGMETHDIGFVGQLSHSSREQFPGVVIEGVGEMFMVVDLHCMQVGGM